MNTVSAPAPTLNIVELTPPPGWQRHHTRVGPGLMSKGLYVLVWEDVESTGRRWRRVSVSRPKRTPSNADLAKCASLFLHDGFGAVEAYGGKGKIVPNMIMLTRSLEPTGDDELLETAARMRTERRADAIVEAMLCLRSRRGRLTLVVVCYSIAALTMPPYDKDDPAHRAVRAIGNVCTALAGQDETLEFELRDIGVNALRALDAARPAASEQSGSRTDAVDAWALAHWSLLTDD